MRIISKFHDYYDAALAVGADERVVYERKASVLQPIPTEWKFVERIPHYLEGSGYRDGGSLNFRKHYFNIRPVIVALAGKIYHGIGIKKMSKDTFRVAHWEEEFFYDLDSYLAHLDEHKIVTPTLTRRDKYYKKSWGKREPWWLGYLYYKEGAEKWLTVERPDQYRDLFIERKVPILTRTTTTKYSRTCDESIELNGNLAKFQFYRRLNAYLTYQELDMFIAGTCSREENPMAGIDDEHLAQAKGFDCYSFKKSPTKRQPKECKK